jgi:hypothetical protein
LDLEDSRWMKEGYNTWLAYGNISPEDALETIKLLQEKFNFAPITQK